MSATAPTSLATNPSGRPPRPSATLVVVREAPSGAEVLLLRRAERGDHNSGAWVFPGGLVEASDSQVRTHCVDADDAAASLRLGVEQGGLDFYIAAVRECLEECGLLFASDDTGAPLSSGSTLATQIAAWRGPLQRGERTLADLCREVGLRLATDRLAYYSHWLTPRGMAKRFDTRFFVAEAPAGQAAAHDASETVELRWLRAADALAQCAAFKLLTPTITTLQHLARFDTAAAFLAWARTPRDVSLVCPHPGTGRQGRRPVLPGEPAYAELLYIDPDGQGTGCYDIQTDVPVRLSSRVIRVTAGNGSLMTGPGTNTYLVGGGARNEWAVIDPGPLDADHVQAILAAAPGPIRWIFATHTHHDHSPAVAPLKAATGAMVYGRLPAFPEWQDASFAPEQRLDGGERFTLDEGITLRAIHTPGHASNHLCYLLEEEKTLFTGDHVMQLSTVVINPPDGDMAAYVASLRSLAESEDLEWLAPGHGFLMSQPRRAIEAIVAHRLKREAKVIAALRQFGPASAETLLEKVYDDVAPKLHAVALRSLRAHLLKLRSDAAADENEGRWALLG